MPALFQLNDFAMLSVSGNDAEKLLQGQLTCDVNELNHDAKLAAHCNPQGRIIYLCHILLSENIYYLILPKSMQTIAMNALKKYAVFYKVQIAASDAAFYGYQGEPDESLQNYLFKLTTPDQRYFILNKNAHELNLPLQTNDSWHQQNILQGIAFIYPESSQKFMPHEINLPQLNGVSFNKGCYTGQEIIARLHYRGKLKSHLQLYSIQTIDPLTISESVLIKDGSKLKPIGVIIDYAKEAYNQYSGLIFMDDEFKLAQLQLLNKNAFFKWREQ